MSNILKCNIVSLTTIINKEITRILRIWPQTILPPVITIILYFFIFGSLIGKKIGQFSGYRYMEYIIPGLIMMTIVTNSYSNVVSSFFGSKFQKNIEELLISPTYNSVIILGFISGGLFRSFIIFIFVFLISYFFSNVYIYNIYALIFGYFITGIIFSIIGLINGIIAKKFDDISIVPTFILTPMIYLGGIFYSTEILPPTFQNITYLNPIFYIANIFRYSIIGISEINVYKAFLIMILLTLILYTLCFYLLKTGYELKK